MVIEDTSRARFMHLVLYRVEPLLRDACEDGRHYRRNILGLRVTSEWSVILKGGFQFSHWKRHRPIDEREDDLGGFCRLVYSERCEEQVQKRKGKGKAQKRLVIMNCDSLFITCVFVRGSAKWNEWLQFKAQGRNVAWLLPWIDNWLTGQHVSRPQSGEIEWRQVIVFGKK